MDKELDSWARQKREIACYHYSDLLLNKQRLHLRHCHLSRYAS